MVQGTKSSYEKDKSPVKKCDEGFLRSGSEEEGKSSYRKDKRAGETVDDIKTREACEQGKKKK